MKGTITPVNLIRHAPTGTSTGLALVDWRDDSSPYGLSGGVREVTRPVYPPSPEGAAFREWRIGQRLTVSEVAKATATALADAFGLESGACSPACGWDELRAIVLRWTAEP